MAGVILYYALLADIRHYLLSVKVLWRSPKQI
jgi:hypothetical protein